MRWEPRRRAPTPVRCGRPSGHDWILVDGRGRDDDDEAGLVAWEETPLPGLVSLGRRLNMMNPGGRLSDGMLP